VLITKLCLNYILADYFQFRIAS